MRLSLLPVPVFLSLGAVLLMALGQGQSDPAEGWRDMALPVFEQPPLAVGQAGLSHTQLLGQVAVLHVFASWCASCRAEHPDLMALAKASDVPFYGLNWRDGKGAGALYLDRFGNPYAATGTDFDGVLGARIGVTGVPETFIVDAGGRIRYRHIGPVTPEIWSTVLKPLIDALESAT